MRLLLAAVVLGGTTFGSATATVVSTNDDLMVVEIEVEVTEAGESVVARLSFEDEPVLTLPLLDRGGGVFGLRTELETKNYLVIFENIAPDGERSEPVSLTQMGADLGPSAGGTTTSTLGEDELSDESRRSLWLAVAFGAASLSLLAFWVLGGRGDDESDEEDDAPAEEG